MLLLHPGPLVFPRAHLICAAAPPTNMASTGGGNVSGAAVIDESSGYTGPATT